MMQVSASARLRAPTHHNKLHGHGRQPDSIVIPCQYMVRTVPPAACHAGLQRQRARRRKRRTHRHGAAFCLIAAGPRGGWTNHALKLSRSSAGLRKQHTRARRCTAYVTGRRRVSPLAAVGSQLIRLSERQGCAACLERAACTRSRRAACRPSPCAVRR